MRAFILFVGQIVLFGGLVAALLAGLVLAAVDSPWWILLTVGAAVVVVVMAIASTMPTPAKRTEPEGGFRILDEEYGEPWPDPVDDHYLTNRRVFGDE